MPDNLSDVIISFEDIMPGSDEELNKALASLIEQSVSDSENRAKYIQLRNFLFELKGWRAHFEEGIQ